MRAVVVIPAYQEAATLRGVVARTLVHCRDVVVVDDGSTDGTARTVADLPITLLTHARNEGKAQSLWDGFEAALGHGADVIFTLDADGQHTPDDIPRLGAVAQRHQHSIVLGARLRQRSAAPLLRRAANALADFGVSWAGGQAVIDSQSGQRAYPAALLRALIDEGALAHGPRAGFTLESALLVAAARRGWRIIAVPIDSVYARDARPSHFRPLLDTVRISGMLLRHLAANGLALRGLWRACSEAPVIEAEGPPQGAGSTMPAASEPRS